MPRVRTRLDREIGRACAPEYEVHPHAAICGQAEVYYKFIKDRYGQVTAGRQPCNVVGAEGGIVTYKSENEFFCELAAPNKAAFSIHGR